MALSQLPPDAFPHLAAAARTARTLDADQEFLGGLALLLDGLEGRTGPGPGGR
ncbi:TetR/AcrR family transcriptional regulator C-terminal domain-containing protein [Streptomyces sp. NPDC101237]|uniref:TetR/AcrR family transcriptional regulator C-terminal domain-containing protein n=1 Tax=Streptomyces sp. NPDC101237 TaxID=3366139 RepID=UPI0037F24B59